MIMVIFIIIIIIIIIVIIMILVVCNDDVAGSRRGVGGDICFNLTILKGDMIDIKKYTSINVITCFPSQIVYCGVLSDILLMLMESTTKMVTGEMTFQHHLQIKRGGLFVMYFISSLNLQKITVAFLNELLFFSRYSSDKNCVCKPKSGEITNHVM